MLNREYCQYVLHKIDRIDITIWNNLLQTQDFIKTT